MLEQHLDNQAHLMSRHLRDGVMLSHVFTAFLVMAGALHWMAFGHSPSLWTTAAGALAVNLIVNRAKATAATTATAAALTVIAAMMMIGATANTHETVSDRCASTVAPARIQGTDTAPGPSIHCRIERITRIVAAPLAILILTVHGYHCWVLAEARSIAGRPQNAPPAGRQRPP